jgi:acetyl-CoA acetyltransferase
MAGITPDDVDVALLYDHFSPMVLMQVEDYGFCDIGEGGRSSQRQHPLAHGEDPGEHPRRAPVGAYIIGMTHVREAVEQLRCRDQQVEDAEIALVTGGLASLPVSATLLRR